MQVKTNGLSGKSLVVNLDEHEDAALLAAVADQAALDGMSVEDHLAWLLQWAVDSYGIKAIRGL